MAATADVGHALAAHTERRAGLRACRNRQILFAVERGNLDFTAERESGEVEWDLAIQIIAVALEECVFLNVDDHVEIARWPTARTGFAFAAQAQPLPGGDASGNADAQFLFLLNASRAATCLARLGDDLARAAALTAGSRNREESLLVSNLTATLTLRA